MAFDYVHALGRLANRPLLITPDKAAQLFAVVAGRAGRDVSIVHAGREVSPVAFGGEDSSGPLMLDAAVGSGRKLYSVQGGVAVIDIEGVLVQKLGTLDPYCGMTGYDGISVKLEAAAVDPEIRGVALRIDSCGGEVAGCFDCCDLVRDVREAKPVWAICDEVAYSAAYALASQATLMTLPRTGGVGSIGVVCMHVSMEAWLQKEGLAVTLIHAGEHKVDGNPFEALPPEVQSDIKAETETIRALFAATVEAGRENLTAAQALATEARCYMGAAAVAAGLADEVAAPGDAFAAFLDDLAASPPSMTQAKRSR